MTFEIELPSVVLPDPDLLVGPICVDVETTGLFVDDGATVVASGVAYRRSDDPGFIHAHAFPFDIGDAERKGFAVQRLKSGKARGGDDSWDEPQPNLGQDEWDCLTEWMAQAVSRVGYVNQNVKFDLHMNRGGAPHGWGGVDLEPFIPAGKLYDTMLGTSVLDPTAGTTSLKPTAARIWGDAAVEEAADQKQALIDVKKRYGLRAEHGPRYDLVPWEILGPYTFADAVLALRLHELQMERIDSGELPYEEYAAACRLMRVLYRIERRGLGPYDVETSHKIADRIDARIQDLADALPFDPPTAARATAYFFDELGIAPWEPGEERREVIPHPTKAGEMKVVKQGTLTVDVSRRMAAAGVPGAAEYAEFVDLTMANRMFYRNYAELAGADRQLRTSFRQAYVRSGRMALPLDEPVLTPSGWRPIGELEVGDAVIGSGGRATKIRAIPFEGDAEVYEVRIDDGTVVRCSDNHLWPVRTHRHRDPRRLREFTAADLAGRDLAALPHHLPDQPVVEYDPAGDPPLDPYVLGVLLGDGSFDTPPRWVSHLDDANEIASYVAAGCPGAEIRRGARRADSAVRHSVVDGGISEAIAELGLRGATTFAKAIPESYLRGSVEERYALLRGLMDTDGTVGRGRESRFFTSSAALRDGVVELVRSLGGLARVRTRPAHDRVAESYAVSVRTPECPFRLRRKADRWVRASRFGRRIVSVAPTGAVVPMRCITVEAEDGLFLTRGMVVTHNSVERFQAQALPKHTGITLLGDVLPEPRSLFGVAPGRRRVNLDLAQAELRIAAQLADCKPMVSDLKDGADFHGRTTTAVFGLHPGDPEWSAYRDIAKRLTFGSIFMIGAPRFQATLMQLAGVKWELSRCRDAVQAWRSTYPEFGVEYENWSQYAQVNRRVPLYDGVYSWMAGPQDYPNTAWNRRVQGSLARWVGNVWLPTVERMTAVHEALVLTVHDSVVLDLPTDVADDLVTEIKAFTETSWLEHFGIPGGCDESGFEK